METGNGVCCVAGPDDVAGIGTPWPAVVPGIIKMSGATLGGRDLDIMVETKGPTPLFIKRSADAIYCRAEILC